MFARVSTMEGKKEQVEKGILEYRDKVLPAARKMSGFKGAFLLIDRKSGKNLGITLWDTEKDLKASTAVADKLRAQASQTVGAASPPVVEIFEVAVQS